MSRAPAIGIDLGTTDSCVAVFRNGAVEVIPNDRGNFTTPSYVAFTATQRLLGESARNQVATNPDNTVFAFKRLIGLRHDDPNIAAYSKHWPFHMVSCDGKPKVLISYRGHPSLLSAEELSAMVLTKLKESAEIHLGGPVEDAVITVPSSFNTMQRQATKDAATIAGLNPIRIINEPTAAAIAYGFHRRDRKSEEKVVIFDLGGGTCNVTVLTLEGHIFEVTATAGNNYLGGEDFDQRLMGHFIAHFKKQYSVDLTRSKRALNRLRVESERVKRILSSNTQTVVEMDSLYEGKDLHLTITRKQFEKMNADLFKATLEPVHKALDDAKLRPCDVDEIILVGGSTRIPRIQKHLEEFFAGKDLNRSMNRVEGVAHGAALQAAVLNGDMATGLQDLLLLDVLPVSLGIESPGGVMTTVIKRNTNIPTMGRHFLTAPCLIQVYEGERALVKDNHYLARFEVEVRGQSEVEIEVTFDVNANSILDVTAVEKNTKRECRVTRAEYSHLGEELERMIEHARQFLEDDAKQRAVLAARNNLESYCYTLQDTALSRKGEEVLTWLETTGALAGKEEIEQKHRELEALNANPTVSMEEASSDLVPSEDLLKLKCGKCAKYLSHFPICIDGASTVCGRCCDSSLTTRNTTYETLAQLMRFPCIYNEQGCLHNLHPAQVPSHEEHCSFRPLSCPLCTWSGTITHLLRHFEETHPKCVRRSPEFEVDLTQSYQLIELLVHHEELFTFKREYSQRLQMLECSLHCHKLNPASSYLYQISLKNASDPSTCMTSPANSTDTVTKIPKDLMTQNLHNPPAIWGCVNILQPQEQCAKAKPLKRTNPHVNYDLLTELECPVCFNYIQPPIYQCVTGHSICAQCKRHIVQCPICRQKIENFHNITLEKMAQLINYPCRFTEYGCDYVSKPAEMEAHEKYCVHGPFTCPLQDYAQCEQRVPLKDMFGHVLHVHGGRVLESNTVEVPINESYHHREDYACYVIRFRGSLFKLQYLHRAGDFCWSVQLVGPPEEAKQYHFEIDVCDNSSRRVFLRSVCAALANKEGSFQATDHYVFLKLDQICSFITDRLRYKICVIT